MRQDRGDDCLSCKIVGKLRRSHATMNPLTLTLNLRCRQRCIFWLGRVQLLVWHVATRKAACRHTAEELHVWHAQPEAGHRRHLARTGVDGDVEGVSVRAGRWLISYGTSRIGQISGPWADECRLYKSCTICITTDAVPLSGEAGWGTALQRSHGGRTCDHRRQSLPSRFNVARRYTLFIDLLANSHDRILGQRTAPVQAARDQDM